MTTKFPHLPNWKHLPKLPHGAAYMVIDNRKQGNALTLDVIRDLKRQLIEYNTSPLSGKRLFLPQFKPSILSLLEKSAEKWRRHGQEDDYTWLVSSKVWAKERHGLPNIIVLASGNNGNNFCSGHSIHEIRHEARLGPEGVRQIFTECGELMSMIRRSPVLIAARVKGNLHGAGVQLAAVTDMPISHRALYKSVLPGKTLGFPCTAPGVVLGRTILRSPREVMSALIDGEVKFGKHVAFSYGENATHEKWCADLDSYLVKKVKEVLQSRTQPMAMAKWAVYAQMGLRGQNHLDADGNEVEGCGGDGLEDALGFAARVMALHSQSEDAIEEMDAFHFKSRDKFGRSTTFLEDQIRRDEVAGERVREGEEVEGEIVEGEGVREIVEEVFREEVVDEEVVEVETVAEEIVEGQRVEEVVKEEGVNEEVAGEDVVQGENRDVEKAEEENIEAENIEGETIEEERVEEGSVAPKVEDVTEEENHRAL